MAAQWYCLIGQQQHGPFTSQQIQQLVQQGQLQRQHYVRTETDSQWTAAGDLPGLFPSLQAVSPQPAAPSVASQPKKKRVAPPPPPAAIPTPPVSAVAAGSQARPVTPPTVARGASPLPASPAPATPSGVPRAAMPTAAAPMAGVPRAAAAVPVMPAPAAAAASVPSVRQGSKPSSAARPIPLHPVVPPAPPAPPSAAARNEGGSGRRSSGSRQKSQLLAGGLTAALVLLAVVAAVVMSRGSGKKPSPRSGRATASAQGGGAEPNANPESDPTPIVTPSKEPGTIADPPQAAPTAVKETATEPKPNPLPAVGKWLDATRYKGAVRDVVGIRMGRTWLDKADGKPAVLNVEIQITNRSADEPLEFSGWRPDDQPQVESQAAMVDDAGAALRAAAARPAAGRGAARRWIAPGESTTEQLSFVFPDNNAKHFRLALPYAALGQTGYLGFELPRQMIKTEAMKEPAEPAADEPPKEEKEPEPEKKPDLRKSIEQEDQKPVTEGQEPPGDGMKEGPKSP